MLGWGLLLYGFGGFGKEQTWPANLPMPGWPATTPLRSDASQQGD